MKHIIIAMLTLFLSIMVFFTFSGQRLYESMTPTVEVLTLGKGLIWNSEKYLVIPERCVSDGCVWIVAEERGFSMTLYTLQKRDVSFAELPEETGIQPGYLYIPQKELSHIQYLAADGNGDYYDGLRIIPKTHGLITISD